MFGEKQDKDILGAYCVFWVISILLTLVVILCRDPSTLGVWKIFVAIPYGLHGAIALEVFDVFRKSGGLQDSSLLLFSIGQAFHGIFGIFLFFWCLVTCCTASAITSIGPNKSLKHGTGFRSRFFFYYVLIELGFVASLIIATALSYSHVPLGYAGCRRRRLIGTDLETIGLLTDVYAKRMCTRVVTTQITAIMSAILAFAQTIPYVPLIAYPRYVRYFLFLIFHRPATGNLRDTKRNRPDLYDPEKLMLSDRSTNASRLHKVLANDSIAQKIAQNLHFIDIANLSSASRTVCHAVRTGTGADPEKRLQLLCEASCIGGEKTECWACAQMICKTCRYERYNIPEPRTLAHATSCYAVCTICYLFSAPAMPASWEATSHADDLSVQHNSCWRECSQTKQMEKDVPLCRSCNRLSNAEVSEVREHRDAEALRRAHGGRLWCAQCSKSLGKGKRRWFICEKGLHECHWQGHQVC